MKYTVGARLRKRHAKQLCMEWSAEYVYTNIYDSEEEAKEKKAEWERNPRNDSSEYKIIPLEEISHTGGGETLSVEYLPVEEAESEKEWIVNDTPCSDPRCLR